MTPYLLILEKILQDFAIATDFHLKILIVGINHHKKQEHILVFKNVQLITCQIITEI